MKPLLYVSCHEVPSSGSQLYSIIQASMYIVMVNHQCVLYIGWSRYTEIIVNVIIEHVKVI